MYTSLALPPWLFWVVCKCHTGPFFIIFSPLHCWTNSFRPHPRGATACTLIYKDFLSPGFLWFSYLEYYFPSCPVLPRHITLYISFIVPVWYFLSAFCHFSLVFLLSQSHSIIQENGVWSLSKSSCKSMVNISSQQQHSRCWLKNIPRSLSFFFLNTFFKSLLSYMVAVLQKLLVAFVLRSPGLFHKDSCATTREILYISSPKSLTEANLHKTPGNGVLHRWESWHVVT